MIKIGDRLPDAKFKVRIDDGYGDVSTADIFGGKKIVLFAVPGAFTPTCSMNHLPGFLENQAEILAKGVDQIAVVAVNDHHVIADGAAAFTKSIGMDMEMGPLGLRSKRYSMIVEDGVVTQLNLETGPGAEVSGAATILGQL